MVRVLHIVGTLECGGIGIFLMNHYRNINRKRVQFDFVIHGDKQAYFKEEILDLGGGIYKVPSKSENLLGNIRQMKKILSNHKYEVIHIHTAGTSSWINACLARLMGVKKVIVHSHGSFEANSKAHMLFRPLLLFFATDYFACSELAGKWLYGDKMVENKKVKVINNAIDTEQFKFDEKKRVAKRAELGIAENKIVFGHVGRFAPEKNHTFLIEVFNKVRAINNDVILYLVGTGEEENNIKKLVKQLEIEDFVKFMGTRKDINELLQVMDIFIFPSKFEGLPVSLIEAQAAGVRCIASECITKEVGITDIIKYLPLEEEVWVQEITRCLGKAYSKEQEKRIKLAGFDINTNIEHLEKIYLN